MSTTMSPSEISQEDIQSIEDAARKFVQTEVAPHLNDWEEAGEFPRALYERAAQMGWLEMGYPEEFGGTPSPWNLRNAMTIALARYGGSGGLMASLFSHNIGLPPVVRHGSAALQREVIPDVLLGKKIAALAITEPGGGTDVSALRTTARLEGDEYVVDMTNSDKRISLFECTVNGSFFGKTEVFRAVGGYRNIAFGNDTDLLARIEEQRFFVQKLEAPEYKTMVYCRTEDSMTVQHEKKLKT